MGGSTSTQTTNSSSSYTPTLSDDWKKVYAQLAGNLNAQGATGGQQSAIDWLSNNMNHNPVWDAVNAANAQYNNVNGAFQSVANSYNDMYNRPAPQAASYLGGMQDGSAYVADAVPNVSAQSGANYMNQYANPYDQAVVQSSVNDYNTNVDRTLNQLRVGRDASGAFGDRAAIADASYLGDATRGLGSLVSGLRQQGFNTAAGYGQQDANRFLQADQGNQSTNLQRNMFNAQQQQQNSQFNANQQQQNSQFNVNAGLQNDAQRMQALQGVTDSIARQAGISQQVVSNIVTANGIDMNNAQAMLSAGQITQGQLAALLAAASAGNGYTETGNSTATTKKGSSFLDVIGALTKPLSITYGLGGP